MTPLPLERFEAYSAGQITVGEKPALLMSNGNMHIMSKKDFYEMVELLKVFYESDGVEAWIKRVNAINSWTGDPLLDTQLVDDKYILPLPPINQMEFRKNLKKDWGFKCDWCQEKVSSKTEEEYFTINETITYTKIIEGRCCSKACAENLWYELLIEWIRKEKLTDVFHTDKTIKA